MGELTPESFKVDAVLRLLLNPPRLQIQNKKSKFKLVVCVSVRGGVLKKKAMRANFKRTSIEYEVSPL